MLTAMLFGTTLSTRENTPGAALELAELPREGAEVDPQKTMSGDFGAGGVGAGAGSVIRKSDKQVASQND